MRPVAATDFPTPQEHDMKLRRLAFAAAVSAVFPLAAGAQTSGVSGQAGGNTVTVPHSQPATPFNQGIGGVGNEGRTGRNADRTASNTAAQDSWRQCQAMRAGPMRDQCLRDYTVSYGAAGDPDGRFYNRHIGGVGGVPPQ
jgi:hypothetical protein